MRPLLALRATHRRSVHSLRDCNCRGLSIVTMTIQTKLTVFIAVLIVFLGIDLYTKQLVLDNLELYSRKPVFDGWLDWVHYRNTGIAFGMFRDGDPAWKVPFFVVLGFLAVGMLTYMLLTEPVGRLGPVYLGLIGSGAVGNITDRVRHGSVVDFIRIYRGTWEWPAFNIADAAICVGAIMFAWYSLQESRRKRRLTETEMAEETIGLSHEDD